MEHYRNLTYKHIMGLKWLSTFCSNARTVVKVDDDTFVNVFQLSTFLRFDGYFSSANSQHAQGMYCLTYGTKKISFIKCHCPAFKDTSYV